jgi:hypothetical protein
VEQLQINTPVGTVECVQCFNDPTTWVVRLMDRTPETVNALVQETWLRTIQVHTQLVSEERVPKDSEFPSGPLSAVELAKEGVIGYVHDHVDDFWASGFEDLVKPVIEAIDKIWNPKSKVKNLGLKIGESMDFLGVTVTRAGDGGLHHGQAGYIKEALEKNGMGQCNPVATPIETNQPDPVIGDEAIAPPPRKIKEAQVITGTLNWPVTHTRIDICHPVNRASRWMTRAPEFSDSVCKRVLRYLKGTEDHGLFYTYAATGRLTTSSLAEYEKDDIVLYSSDMSFAPSEEESHGCGIATLAASRSWH